MKKRTFFTSSAKETIEFAKKFAKTVKPGTVFCLEGQLGSGKTTFVKGLAEGLGMKRPEQVKSPTFVLMHVYKAKVSLYHFDCYRLDSVEELEEIGLDDFVNDPNAISCVEWAEKAKNLLPSTSRHISFEILGPTKRRISIS
ncbi:MAG TPA: tRNA (adenosine(37)-N6)-threonylcarbamoyltransferase complex ATPase subunit type 1 TsaE [Candidatus Omnitrophota bacterium]|nr:tRNA (adenosine(37)-N6)-threonylcarbamoyltransferase complex ATPase subunit type 1 TsaE [Candidatus Omnitrophota bacterium]HPS37530.1 tRNA (adenosine(37)-N6)-threonylcarbamoyltransferase complex ATPase subunit type 1 TsaE [Candidatus Omnitrophota bacterium]